jgi:hypothetical protein
LKDGWSFNLSATRRRQTRSRRGAGQAVDGLGKGRKAQWLVSSRWQLCGKRRDTADATMHAGVTLLVITVAILRGHAVAVLRCYHSFRGRHRHRHRWQGQSDQENYKDELPEHF